MQPTSHSVARPSLLLLSRISLTFHLSLARRSVSAAVDGLNLRLCARIGESGMLGIAGQKLDAVVCSNPLGSIQRSAQTVLSAAL